MIIRIVLIASFLYLIYNNINYCEYTFIEKNIKGPVITYNLDNNNYIYQFLVDIRYKNNNTNINTNFCMNNNKFKNIQIYTSDYSIADSYYPNNYIYEFEKNSIYYILFYIFLFIFTIFSYIFY